MWKGMVINMKCIIDARIHNIPSERSFISLGLWGKTAFCYPVEAACESGLFESIDILVDDDYIRFLVKQEIGDTVNITEKMPDFFSKHTFVISAKAVMVRAETLVKAYNSFHEQENDNKIFVSAVRKPEYNKTKLTDVSLSKIPVFTIVKKDSEYTESNLLENNDGLIEISEKESVLLDTVNSFELALVLINKDNKAKWLRKQILDRITEKENVFKNNDGITGDICLVGHSQIDQWDIDELCGHKVRNCGISGISSFEYKDFILDKKLLNCSSDTYIVMHGTNDIVYDTPIVNMVMDIQKTIDYIRNNNGGAKIYFINCLHVNGRLDRQNERIDSLNGLLKDKLEGIDKWISTEKMDDPFGNLKTAYTRDGLHLSKEGYDMLRSIIEAAF